MIGISTETSPDGRESGLIWEIPGNYVNFLSAEYDTIVLRYYYVLT